MEQEQAGRGLGKHRWERYFERRRRRRKKNKKTEAQHKGRAMEGGRRMHGSAVSFGDERIRRRGEDGRGRRAERRGEGR